MSSIDLSQLYNGGIGGGGGANRTVASNGTNAYKTGTKPNAGVNTGSGGGGGGGSGQVSQSGAGGSGIVIIAIESIYVL
jgi:hypothetical protein